MTADPHSHVGNELASEVPYRYAEVAKDGDLVFTAGACPLDSHGRIIGPDLAAQTRQTLRNLRLALEAAGCRESDVIKTTVFVASSAREDLLVVWGEYERVFGSGGPPSTLVGVTVLGYRDQLVEIEAVAARPPAGAGAAA